MKKLILLFFLIFTSCTTNYYFITNAEDISLLSSPSEGSQIVEVIPAGTYYYSDQGFKKFRRVKYAKRKGYILNPYFQTPNYNTNSSYRSSSTSETNYRPKTVNVKAYTRKDGTQVQAHTRSAPRRK